MSCSAAAARSRWTGSTQGWNARLNVPQWIGSSTRRVGRSGRARPPPGSCGCPASARRRRRSAAAVRSNGPSRRRCRRRPGCSRCRRRRTRGAPARRGPRRPERGVAAEARAPRSAGPRCTSGSARRGASLVPVELDDPVVGNTPPAQVLAHARAGRRRRAPAVAQQLDGGQVEVVVVVVGDHDGVDRRQLVERDRRRVQPARADQRATARPARPTPGRRAPGTRRPRAARWRGRTR